MRKGLVIGVAVAAVVVAAVVWAMRSRSHEHGGAPMKEHGGATTR